MPFNWSLGFHYILFNSSNAPWSTSSTCFCWCNLLSGKMPLSHLFACHPPGQIQCPIFWNLPLALRQGESWLLFTAMVPVAEIANFFTASLCFPFHSHPEKLPRIRELHFPVPRKLGGPMWPVTTNGKRAGVRVTSGSVWTRRQGFSTLLFSVCQLDLVKPRLQEMVGPQYKRSLELKSWCGRTSRSRACVLDRRTVAETWGVSHYSSLTYSYIWTALIPKSLTYAVKKSTKGSSPSDHWNFEGMNSIVMVLL